MTIDLTIAANRPGNSNVPQQWEEAIRAFLKEKDIIAGNAPGGDEHVRLTLRQFSNKPDGSEQYHIMCIGLPPQLAPELGKFMDALYVRTINVGKTNFEGEITSQLKPSVVFAKPAETGLGQVSDARKLKEYGGKLAL